MALPLLVDYNWGVNSPYKWAGAATNSPARGTTKGGFVMLPDSTPGGDAVKRCSKCGEEKPENEMSPGRRVCRTCQNTYWRVHHRERRGQTPRVVGRTCLAVGETKQCLRCQSSLSSSEFVKDKNRPDGLFPYCRTCVRIYKQGHYATNKDKLRPNFALYRRTHRATIAAGRLRRRARELAASGIATDAQLDQRWEFYGGLCWMCGGTAREWDHVIPLSKGGSNWPANLRPSCRSCNASKNARPFALVKGRAQ